jgi:tetratricopeptide (TPR) repeat protein
VKNTQIANTNVNNVTNVSNVSNTAVNNFARPWGAVNGGWYQGSFGGGWSAYPSAWAGQGFAASGYASGYASDYGTAGPPPEDQGWAAPVAPPSQPVYSNPYFADPSASSTTEVEASAFTVSPQLDYSQPIAVPTRAQEEDEDDDVVAAAKRAFDRARLAFSGGLYRTALSRVEAGLKLLPGDTTMHEFRALCLFALARYREAAGALYAVLSAGPGWNWDTMASLYANPDTYTRHLRRLERHVKQRPKDPRGHFLLGYHYLVLDQRDAAAAEFGRAAELKRRDKLSASLAASLTRPSDQEESDE